MTAQDYLDAALKENKITANTHSRATSVLRLMIHEMSEPNVCVGVDSQIAFSWEFGDSHLEMEIYDSGIIECFYLNYKTGESFEV